MDTVYRAPDGRTQVVLEFEKVKARILTKLGWKPVPQPVVEPIQEYESVDDGESHPLPEVIVTDEAITDAPKSVKPGRKAKK